ncbi:MAG: hypothetical protein HRU75_03340 [Planctomycetia bacterium]|nr:MAG: hypothetical protein HRU75_03340 [Planctomycetia bacterium]
MDSAFRRCLAGPRCTFNRDYLRLVTGESHPFGNFALIGDTSDPGVTNEAVASLLACNAPSAALYVGTPTASVVERLHGHGFEAHGTMPAMVVEIDRLAPTLLPPGYTLERVGSGAAGDAWVEAFAAGYELPHAVAEVFSPGAVGATTDAAASLQYFAVMKAGRMVCTSMVFMADGVAGVYCVSTRPEERGLGLAAHATAEPLRMVRDIGFRVGGLQSSPMGVSVYRRLGFETEGEIALYVRMGGK